MQYKLPLNRIIIFHPKQLFPVRHSKGSGNAFMLNGPTVNFQKSQSPVMKNSKIEQKFPIMMF